MPIIVTKPDGTPVYGKAIPRYLMHDWLLRTLDNHYMYLASLASKSQPFLLTTYLTECMN